MAWVDTHCHLQLDGRDPSELLDRATEVDWVVVPGVDLDSSKESLALAADNPGRVLPTAGLHPHDAVKWKSESEAIAELAVHVSAVGETGLDFYRDLSPRKVQRTAFNEQIALAIDYDKPLVVHCRDAFADVFEILEETGAGPRSVLHCWTGGTRWTKRFLDLGVVFSYAGPVAFETGETIRLGDTPYLAPPPHRGAQNEPAWVALVGSALAGVWGMGVEDVAAVTSSNAARIFRS